MTIAGLLIGFFFTMWLPLPRWRLLGALVAVSCLMIGADLAAISSLNLKGPEMPEWEPALGGGILMGVAIGYFANWIRSAWVEFNLPQRTRTEQRVDPNA